MRNKILTKRPVIAKDPIVKGQRLHSLTAHHKTLLCKLVSLLTAIKSTSTATPLSAFKQAETTGMTSRSSLMAKKSPYETRFPSMLTSYLRPFSALFNGYGLGKVSRPVNVAPSKLRNLVGKHLTQNTINERFRYLARFRSDQRYHLPLRKITFLDLSLADGICQENGRPSTC